MNDKLYLKVEQLLRLNHLKLEDQKELCKAFKKILDHSPYKVRGKKLVVSLDSVERNNELLTQDLAKININRKSLAEQLSAKYELNNTAAAKAALMDKLESEFIAKNRAATRVMDQSLFNNYLINEYLKEKYYITFEIFHRKIFDTYVCPILNHILTQLEMKERRDYSVFNKDFLKFGFSIEAGNTALHNKSKALVNYWFESANRDGEGKTSPEAREKYFIAISEELNTNELNYKQFWKKINTIIACWVQDNINSEKNINPYFLTFIGYEVFIALTLKLESEVQNTTELDNSPLEGGGRHFYATSVYIGERETWRTTKEGAARKKAEKSDSLKHDIEPLSTIKVQEPSEVGIITKNLCDKGINITWLAVFSKYLHHLAEKSENLCTKDEKKRDEILSFITTILSKAKVEIGLHKVEIGLPGDDDKSINSIQSGLDDFGSYVSSIEGKEDLFLGSAPNGLSTPELAYYGWGKQFYTETYNIINSLDLSPDVKKFMVNFILLNLPADSTHSRGRELRRSKLYQLHCACIQIKIPVYFDIDELLNNWGYVESREFIKKSIVGGETNE